MHEERNKTFALHLQSLHIVLQSEGEEKYAKS